MYSECIPRWGSRAESHRTSLKPLPWSCRHEWTEMLRTDRKTELPAQSPPNPTVVTDSVVPIPPRVPQDQMDILLHTTSATRPPSVSSLLTVLWQKAQTKCLCNFKRCRGQGWQWLSPLVWSQEWLVQQPLQLHSNAKRGSIMLFLFFFSWALALGKPGKNSTTELYGPAWHSSCVFNFEKGFYVAWQITCSENTMALHRPLLLLTGL